ncbi:MAG: hypothetical protein FD123_1178 [Bacteroidetes bacterium]|nr:MAG: hypothetical protein FD123_1178 [Bacteroidota bacterium]
MLTTAFAQDLSKGRISGNFEIDAQYYNPDSAIGAPAVPEKALMNGWGNINYVNGKFSAGVRYESYLNVMQGYDPRNKGTGLPYRFASYNNEDLEITVGSFYEQFGTGLTLRAYEDRGLLYDNALDGVRARFKVRDGLYLKGLWGKQRTFFTTSPGIVRGFDGEINLNEFFANAFDSCKTTVILGGSFVSKYQADQDPSLVLPENVGVSAGRFNIIRGKINFSGEYAYKINDPSTTNGFIYKPGEAIFTSLVYSQKGLGIALSAKRIDNMSYRSDRSATLTAAMINYLPALTRQHTYPLAAFYPYATQPNGEVGWQADIGYKFKKGTKFGGKYGTDIAVNYSAAYGLDTTNLNDENGRRFGYSAAYFSTGEEFFQDINVEISKKISKKLKGTLLYSNIRYNKNVIEGKSGYPIIASHIAVVDIIYRITDDVALRTDLEHLYATEDHGSWAVALVELTMAPHWFVAGIDQYNYGNEHVDERIHYFSTQVGYTRGTNRIALGYGKQRAGIFCVGGVCRFVPASNGFTLVITSSF